MRTNEETFFIQDAQHQQGTNRYTFTFPPHWRRTNQKSLSIAIRSVKLINGQNELAVSASFVDMNERKWLGITNEQFIPPKEYPITYDDQKFWIELHSLDSTPIELNDEQLVIEAMMNSYL